MLLKLATLVLIVSLQCISAIPYAIDGTFESQQGERGSGAISLQLLNSTLIAREVPEPRSWGLAQGSVLDGAITGMNLSAALPLNGVLEVADNDSGITQIDAIQWSDGSVWQRVQQPTAYRYLRLSITETLSRVTGGVVTINEIHFQWGDRDAATRQPSIKMHGPTSGDGYGGQAVACSSEVRHSICKRLIARFIAFVYNVRAAC
jgi:hypothetical protein